MGQSEEEIWVEYVSQARQKDKLTDWLLSPFLMMLSLSVHTCHPSPTGSPEGTTVYQVFMGNKIIHLFLCF